MVSTSGISGTARHVTVPGVTEPDAAVVADDLDDADELDAVFAEVVDAAAEILTLPDAARVEVWASSMLAIWREPGVTEDPSAVDRRFVAYLRADGAVGAAAVLAALRAFDLAADSAPDAFESAPWATHVGTAVAVGAARVNAVGMGEALVLEFCHSDGVRHCLMADIDNHRLSGLTFGPGLVEMVEADEDGVLRVTPVAVEEVASELRDAWLGALDDGGELDDDYLMNHLLAEVRLRSILGDATAGLLRVPGDTWVDPMSADERAESNRWAAATLRSALRVSGEAPVAEGLALAVADLVEPAAIAARPRSEREALRGLEWADWLGAVIGLVRGGPGIEVTGASLVELVNRCPEVTSTIPKAERPYYEWAFGVAVAAMTEAGIVADGRLTEPGAAALVPGLLAAWETLAV